MFLAEITAWHILCFCLLQCPANRSRRPVRSKYRRVNHGGIGLLPNMKTTGRTNRLNL
jgi:hypothetical protein